MALIGQDKCLNQAWGGPPQPPKSEPQCAAERWYVARHALTDALQRSNEASAALQMAQQEEQSAWSALEDASGRAPITKATSR